MTGPKHLTFEEQIDLLVARGMNIPDKSGAMNKIENIGYYKLKEFAFPLSSVVTEDDGTKTRRYDGVEFSSVITRYYQDKNLRLNVLHAIEKIEVSLKTRISFVLGESHGAFGYLKFGNWCNKKEYCKHYLKDQEEKFKYQLIKKIKLSHSHELTDKVNLNEQGLPSVWLMTDVLMFGDVIALLKLMSNKNLRMISSYYNCTNDELLSWLKCLNFIRNICAHNSNILDIKLKTTPKIHPEWKNDIFKMKNNNYSNRLAVVIYIVHHFIREINNKYHIYKIPVAIEKIVKKDEKKINQLGFVNAEAIKKLKVL
ncbi:MULTISPECIES: Abi family protein [Staphylococcaceae]|uniref:Abi family protein n=1 Tax=Macrococcus psychrotolerans TaxID=3039389 RepID=A0AAT9P1F7_9STAP|nr:MULTISPECIES: Abi family protein [Macrococcus]MDJ1111419.1 Abi family protein [Macrococcus sp. S115]MEB8172142.1 Abi family protein [Macrococcus caseolyticus]PKE22536.1 CAAX protease [Macrococcus caseolyticus]PKF22474.1 CAAX protease [Macrococcus caseolyticus]PKF36962.1 CAAX protease [Macrococcus caseolyticus]